MKFTAFRVLPAVSVFFHDEGNLYFRISEDQDPDALAMVREAFPLTDSLPEDIDLVWAGDDLSSVAFREVGTTDETSVSGDFNGFYAILEADYVDAEGGARHIGLSEGDEDLMAKACAGLNALLQPTRLVCDVSGGAIHATYTDRPAVVIYKSDDTDDVMAQEGRYSDDEMVKDMSGDNVATWTKEAEVFSDIVDHYHSQVKPC